MKLHLFQTNSFTGPGMFCFEFKECRIESGLRPIGKTEADLARVLDAMIREKIPLRGHFKWYNGQYGPIILDFLSAADFGKCIASGVTDELDRMVEAASIHFKEFSYANGEPEIVKHKIHALLGFIPTDTTAFFKYTRPIGKSNPGSIHLMEHNQYDYFHLLIGFNDDSCYLISLFWD